MNRCYVITLTIILILLAAYISGCINYEKKILNEAKIIYVDDDGTGDYISIQDAINAANDGDTIIVRNGTYNEMITLDKSLYLIGEDKHSTIITLGRSDYDKLEGAGKEIILIRIKNDHCIIENFTIKTVPPQVK